ncbi:MAG: hypothetical protein J7L47_00265 [Candidatus Odinarchaeota archaeon]|nr:hypothetical protein [Candidatus Odinarchaeota archaeon]
MRSVTNSGSATAEPALTVNTVLFGPLSPYFFGTLIVALAAVVAIKQIQARKRKALEEYKLTISYYEDLLKIRHFLIIHKGSGVSMFYKAYGTDPFEPDLISGFITALSQFGTEIVETTSETVELKQRGLYIFATDTKYMRFAIMSSEELSSTFKKILTDTIKSLGEKYDPMVANWRGDLRASKEIGLALENKLALSFFYVPVAIKTTQNLKGKELVVVDKIQNLLKKLPNVNLKQIIDMLGREDLPVIISLVKRQVIGTASKKLNHNRPDVSEKSSEENNKKAD